MYLRDQGYREATVAGAMLALKRLYEAARYSDMAPNNPVTEAGLHFKRPLGEPLPALTPPELRALFAQHDDSPELSALVAVLLLAGVKLKESLDLNWSDAMSHPYLLITGRNGRRIVPRCATLTRFLERWQASAQAHSGDRVFHMTAATARRRLAGVPVRQLRHTFVNALVGGWPGGWPPIDSLRIWLGFRAWRLGMRFEENEEVTHMHTAMRILDSWAAMFLNWEEY